MSYAPLCARTLALFRPGIPIPGTVCYYTYTGRMPCTGSLRCFLCGKVKP